MIVDDIIISVKAGNGGKGAVAFNKNLMSLGPAGGNGGKGGSVFVEGVSDLSALKQFRFKKEAIAQNGADGKEQFSDGSDGADLVLKIPVGTIIHNIDKKEDREILKIGERILIAKGGIGGRGNFQFRSSRNTTPRQFQPGIHGELYKVQFELKFIADVGLIGLPNAGKSSLLNALTNAKAKTANYPFTTLEPNLGTYYNLILADIPGLIEGASSGKGLGVKFLKHIERTNVLFHLISADSSDPISDYNILKKELKKWNPKLLQKKEYIFLSKKDIVSDDESRKKEKIFKKISENVMTISVIDDESLKKVKDVLNTIQREKKW